MPQVVMSLCAVFLLAPQQQLQTQHLLVDNTRAPGQLDQLPAPVNMADHQHGVPLK